MEQQLESVYPCNLKKRKMDIENNQQKILQRLMYKPVMTFNELWDKEGRSNKFAYHLKTLEKKGLVEKRDDGYYQLTHEGKQKVAYIENETGKEAKFPLLVVATVIIDETSNKILMFKRTKEPFYGYWGFQGGKLTFSDYILECAQKEIKQETGFECDIELKGLFSAKTFNNDKLSFNHQLFVVKGTNPRGQLLEKTREGENKWMTREEINSIKTLPNIPLLIDIAFSKNFRWIEADRIQKDGIFVDMNVRKDSGC